MRIDNIHKVRYYCPDCEQYFISDGSEVMCPLCDSIYPYPIHYYYGDE